MATSDSAARRQEIVRGLGIALLVSLLLSALHLAGAFESFDLRLLDWRFRLRGERPASDAIAIVGVDDATIHAYGSWPVRRDQYALLISALEEARAGAIAVDLQFPDDLNQDPAWNHLLAQVTGNHENVVHAIRFDAEGADPRPLTPDAERILRSQGLPGEGGPAPRAASVALPFPELLSAARSLGHVTAIVDPDGAIRRLPMLIRHEDLLYASLALRSYGAYRGWRSPESVHWSGRAAVVEWPTGGRTRLPVGDDGSTAIDFAGDREAFDRSYSMLKVLRWYVAGDSARLREAFAGKIVLIGLVSARELSEEVGPTPFAAATPLVYVHASAMDNLLRDRFLVRPPRWLHASLLVGLGGMIGWGFVALPIVWAGIVMGLATVLLAGIDHALFAGLAIDVPPTAALALAPLIYTAIGTHRYLFLERRSRQREKDIREGRSVQQRFLPEALIGQRLSHFEIVEKLGAGGMGVVYRGRDRHLARDVAVKVLTGASLADEEMRRRFRHEALALSRLNHPRIATIFDFDSQDGTDFLVMEFVPGASLSDVLEHGPLPESNALAVAIDVADALEAAHAHGVLHRDLKPANVMLTTDGRAKILDFGVAKILGDSTTTSTGLTKTGTVVGTMAYLAPELLTGREADARTDVYGLGMVLFEILTGVRPFSIDPPHELMHKILNESPPEPRGLNPKISLRTQGIVMRALEKDPGARFASAGEMLMALREAAVAAGSSDPT